jgi:hypothetical protein
MFAAYMDDAFIPSTMKQVIQYFYANTCLSCARYLVTTMPLLAALIQKIENASAKGIQMQKNKQSLRGPYFRITINYDINSGSITFMLCPYITDEVFIDPHTSGREIL